MDKIVYLLFLCSGLSALMYEVVWLRALSRMMGVTIYATSTILAAFMAGLALGSYIFGKFIDNRRDGLRVYAILELLIAVAAIIVPFIFHIFPALNIQIQRFAGDNLFLGTGLKAVFLFLVLLVPTTLMGGTLPVLTSFLVTWKKNFGKHLSLLYGINTIGAVLGVVISGFITIGALGEKNTIMIAVAINVIVALFSYLLYHSSQRKHEKLAGAISKSVQDIPISPYSTPVRRIILAAFTLSGLTALALEVIWTRQLILFLQTSIYAFSGMLATFLAGMGIGSSIFSSFSDKIKSPLIAFGILELLVGLIAIINLFIFPNLDTEIIKGLFGIWTPVFATFVLVFPITMLLGMIYPIATLCYANTVSQSGSSVGRANCANTIGGIIGSLIAGFLFIPMLGSTNTVLLLSCLNIVLGIILLNLEPRRSFAFRACVFTMIPIAVMLVLIAQNRDPFFKTIEKRIAKLSSPGAPNVISYHKEGREGTVTSFGSDDYKSKRLWINAVGMTWLCSDTKLMAHLPLMLSENRDDMLIICFGMGTTVRSALIYPELKVTSVELVPEAYETFSYFHEDAKKVLLNNRLNTVVNDGRNYLLLSEKKYDVISVDPAPPVWSAGTVNLYTKEFFSLCYDHLNPGGVMCLWFPGGKEEDIEYIYKTFFSVFPDATVWKGLLGIGVYLIGPKQMMDMNQMHERARIAFRNPDMVEDLREFDDLCVSKDQLMSLFLYDKTSILPQIEGVPVISDNYPYTEFPLWRKWVKRRWLKFKGNKQ